MSLPERSAGFCLGAGVFTAACWVTFARNLARDPGRPRSFYVVHAALIGANLAVAAGLAVVGVHGLRGGAA